MERYYAFLHGLLTVLIIAVLFVGMTEIFVMSYIVIFIIVVVRTLMTPGRRTTRRYRVLAYTAILIVQLAMVDSVLYSETYVDNVPDFIFRRVLGILSLLVPVIVSRFLASVKYTHYYLPTAGEIAAVGISELISTAGLINESKKKLSIDNLKSLAHDMTRHDSFHYINSRSLTDDYFTKARESFDDPNIYIVISKTGSPASEFISVFTQKQYNHASLSFDKKLQTTISYNGGEKVYPPGLNMELLEFFRKSPDSKIMVYSLPATAEQKKQMLDKIAKINKEGSAYNILGLFIHKRQHKPNILYCTQFVYNMLEGAGLAYFEKGDKKISPTDLVELDYYRKLKFELEITFG
ncbi:MAG: hypothetical protein FWB80_04670 [Defluviitaleaceae bacterium]|nr:hypothetical protein [Defluviitaleaceae bacterium]